MIEKCKPCFRSDVCMMTPFSAENYCMGPFKDEDHRALVTYEEPKRKTRFFDWEQIKRDEDKYRGLR